MLLGIEYPKNLERGCRTTLGETVGVVCTPFEMAQPTYNDSGC